MRSLSIMLVLGLSTLITALLGDQGECNYASDCISGVCEGDYGKPGSTTGARCHGSGNRNDPCGTLFAPGCCKSGKCFVYSNSKSQFQGYCK